MKTRFNKQTAVVIGKPGIAQAIRDDYEMGISETYLAQKYQVTRHAVRKIAQLDKSHPALHPRERVL